MQVIHTFIWSFGVFLCISLSGAGSALVTEKVPVSYQTEEHTNVTLTCSYPADANTPPESLKIHIMNMKPHRRLYWYDSRAEGVRYIDELYRGRLQCDPELSGERQIKCLLTNVGLNDAGRYECHVSAGRKKSSTRFDLVVSGKLKLLKLCTLEGWIGPGFIQIKMNASLFMFHLL